MFHGVIAEYRAQSASESRAVQPKKWTVWVSLLLLLLGGTLTLTLNLCAQTGQGVITGRVTDANGAIVQKASVEVINNETNVILSTTTNDAGLYNVESLNPGPYTVTVASPGFQKEQLNTVTVSAAQTTTADISLKLGASSETVTVSAQASLLSPTTSSVSTTIDHQIVQNLPYPQTGALEAVLLSPGVSTTFPGNTGGLTPEAPQYTTGAEEPGAQIQMSGAEPGSESIQLDGSEITLASYPRAGVNVSGPVVGEMTVITSGAPAMYGGTSGGVIVETTRAGTADYHGLLSWRHNDPFFNAFPEGTTTPSNLHQNFFSIDVGGPVRIPKIYTGRGNNKTFFYVGVEPSRVRNAVGLRGAWNTAADVAGQLHNTLGLLNSSILTSQGYAAAIAAPRIGGIYTNSTVNAQGFPNGPVGSAPATQETGPSGLDDVSAQLAANPFAKFIMSLLPTPSNPGPYVIYDNPQGTFDLSAHNASYIRGVTDIDNRYSIRIDHQFNNRNQIFARYTVEPISGPRFFGVAPSNPMDQVQDDVITSRDIATGYTLILSNNLVNNFHYSLIRSIEDRTPEPSGLTTDFAAKYGLTPATLGKGFPSVGGLGFAYSVGNGGYYDNVDQNFDLGDALTWTKGKHLFQFGGDDRWIQSNLYDTANEFGGSYNFSSVMTNTTGTGSGSGGSNLATLDLGDIYSYQAAPVPVPGYYRWHYYALFAQDDWRILPKLTLNLGLRWETETPRKEKFNNQAIMVASTMANPNTAAFCFSGSCGLGQGLWPTNWHGFEPRVGISYLATPKITVHAAYGLFRTPLTGYENVPDPDFNVASATIGNQTGGTIPNSTVNYITNPVPKLVSAYTALGGSRGPFYSSSGFNPDYVEQTSAVPYMQDWSLSVQYELSPNTIVQVAYQGNKGTHLIGSFASSKNIPTLATLQANVAAGVNLGGTAIVPAGSVGVSGENVLQALNPYPGFANVSLPEIYPRRGSSSYNALYASIVHRYGQGLTMTGYYSWGKSLDNVPNVIGGTGFGSISMNVPQDPHNEFGEWSVSGFDVPSLLKGGYNYELPFGAGKKFQTGSRILNQVIGNFATSGIITWESGFPSAAIMQVVGNFTSFTPQGTNPTPIGIAPGVTAPVCNTASYCAGSALPTGYVLRPNIVPGVPLINPNWKKNPFGLGSTARTQYLNTAAFTAPGTIGHPVLGNAPRTLPGARSPRMFYADMNATKGISFRERYKLNLSATATDVFNHAGYSLFGSTQVYGSQTNTTSGASAPSISYNLNSGFANTNSQPSRVLMVGAQFVF